MKTYSIFILQLIFILSLVSCSSYKPVASKSGSGMSAEEYISKYKDLAINEMKRTGIPASITLAQGMIESDFGRSRLAIVGNNHFGIKCHDDWKGATIRHHDDKRNECFRKYKKPEESFYDHSDFIKSVSRYSFLFDIEPTDYKAWARGLKKAGYATNPDYANLLIRNIEENNLSVYDSGSHSAKAEVQVKDSVTGKVNENGRKPATAVSTNNAVPERVSRIKEINRVQYIIVKEGETKAKLESDFQLLKWELAKYNELNSDFQPVPGQILFLQPKREKAEPGKEYYTAVEGDTMYRISQLFGIKMKSLYTLNRMEEKTEPEAGRKIWLRSVKPVN